MKPIFYTSIFLSGLLLVFSSYSNQPTSADAASLQEQQLKEGQILNIMMTVDKGEIASAKVAIKKNGSPAVDQYAKYLLEQHQDNLESLQQLAKQSDLLPEQSTISDSLETNGQNSLKTLEELQGSEFDKKFINLMVSEHRAGLSLIDKTLLPQTTNLQLKNAVGQFREMVSEHLEKGLEIQSAL